MTIRELTIDEIRKTYRAHLKRDFLPEELKPLAAIERSYRRGEYLCLGAFGGEDMAGYAFFVFSGRTCLLDYFAVLPDRRGCGIGSSFIRHLGTTGIRERCDILVIEIENPRFAEDEEDRNTRTKRLDFYLRCGMINSGVEALVFGVEYLILEYPLERVHTREEVASSYDELYHSRLPGLLYRRNIKVRT